MAIEQRPRRRGDRPDAWLVRGLDSMHQIMPYIMPNRTDNEAVMTETIDLTALNAWLKEKNVEGIEFKYTMFHAILAALTKTIYERPLLNRFISRNRYFDRKEISYSFIVKKKFEDHAAEAVSILRVNLDDERSMIEQMYQKVRSFVYDVRKKQKSDGTTDVMDVIMGMPRIITDLIMAALNFLEKRGRMPAAVQREDPYCSTVFISNLGSIRMSAQYHHLANWGTNSIFVIIGEKYKKRFLLEDDTEELREAVDLSVTVDERIADGVYFANSIHYLKHLLETPELLDTTIKED